MLGSEYVDYSVLCNVRPERGCGTFFAYHQLMYHLGKCSRLIFPGGEWLLSWEKKEIEACCGE
jgi:hypothetical protein